MSNLIAIEINVIFLGVRFSFNPAIYNIISLYIMRERADNIDREVKSIARPTLFGVMRK